MIQLQYTFNGTEKLAQIEAAGWESIQRCTVLLWTECSKAVGISNPRPYVTPAPKGQPPRLRTGWGQRNVAYELDQAKGTGRVGVRRGAIYMVYLDQKDHPWLLATTQRIYPQLQALASRP